MDSIALLTPSSCDRSAESLRGRTHRTDLLADELGARDLLLVGRGEDERVGEGIDGHLADARADAEGLDALGVEELVAEEGSNAGRDAGSQRRAGR